MLSITTTIDEIDALIKNMEFLSPQHNERVRFEKLEDLKSLMQNKQLMDLIKDTAGRDWQNDTENLIKKIDKKHKILQFTDVYINSLRSLLIFKAINDVTSESVLELTKEFGQWTFNARYQGEDYVVKWVDIKVNKYFSKTDLPKKFLDLMNGKPTFEIKKEWVLKNQDFFFNPNIFNDYNVLLKEFIEKIEKNEKLHELEIVKDIPKENDSVHDVPTAKVAVESSTESISEAIIVETTDSKFKSFSESSKTVAKKMIQVGVDIAGDPIMEEVVDKIEVEKTEVVVEVKNLLNEKVDEKQLTEISKHINENNVDLPWEEGKVVENKDIQINKNVEQETVDKQSTLLPWEDEPVVESTEAAVSVEVVKEEVKVEIEAPKPIEKPKFLKPGSSFAKPGSNFKKPGTVVIGSSDNEDDDSYGYYTDAVAKQSVSKSDLGEGSSEWSKVKDNDLFSDVETTSSQEKSPQPVAVENDSFEGGIDFESVLEENQKIQSLFKEETEEKQEELKEISNQPRLFENGMTYNSEKAKELENQKQSDILKIEESIKQREQETKEKLEKSGLSKNSIFMSMKKKEIKSEPENADIENNE